MYVLLVKDETNFNNNNEILQNVSNTIKQIINGEVIYNEQYLKAEAKSTQNKAFILFINE